MSHALFHLDEHGRKQDAALHPDDPAGDAELSKLAVKRAKSRGHSEEEAQRMYGHKGPKLTPVDHNPWEQP